MRLPNRSVGRVALMGGVLVALLISAAAALDVFEDPDPHIPVATEEETAFDTATGMADELGISVEEALTRGEFQLAFTDFIGEMQDLLPGDVFAGGSLLEDGSGGILRFKGDVPKAVSDALTASGLVGVELRGGMEFSRAEAQERAIMVHEAAVALGFTNVRSSYSISSQRVNLFVGPRSGGPSLTGVSLRETLVDAVAGRPDGGKYRLSIDDIEVTEDAEPIHLDHSYGS